MREKYDANQHPGSSLGCRPIKLHKNLMTERAKLCVRSLQWQKQGLEYHSPLITLNQPHIQTLNMTQRGRIFHLALDDCLKIFSEQICIHQIFRHGAHSMFILFWFPLTQFVFLKGCYKIPTLFVVCSSLPQISCAANWEHSVIEWWPVAESIFRRGLQNNAEV